MGKKIATWAVVIFLVYYLVTKPVGAAGALHNLLGWLSYAGSQLAKFLDKL